MAVATRTAYGEALAELIKEDKKVVVLDADLTKSTKTNAAKNACPERHYNMGIAEANMTTVAAGFAAQGYTVFASTFAMFSTGRAWEQVRNSIAYPQLNVKICGTHSGIAVGEDGVSHQAIEDIALMRVIPGMEVYSPTDQWQTREVIKYVASTKTPAYVRLGRANVDDVYDENYKFEPGKVEVLEEGSKVAIFATGLMVQKSLEAAALLKAEGVEPTIVNVCSIKPLDEAGVADILRTHEYIVTVEEHNVIGGLGSAISDVAVKCCPKLIRKVGLQDRFAESANFNHLLDKYGLDAKGIAKEVLDELK